MNLFEKYETDSEKELGGIPVQFDESTFILRRAGGGNRAYRYALAIASAQHRDILLAKDADPVAVFQAQEDIVQQAFAQSVVVGWSNVDGRDGQPLAFSQAAFLDLVKSCPAVWDALKGAAVDDNLFKRAEEDGRLLGESSAGTMNGATE
jgi:hypothetical protein